MTFELIAFTILTLLTIADGVTTHIGIQRGKVEVGPLAVRLMGRRPQTVKIAAYQAAKIGLFALVLMAPYAGYILSGLAGGTAYIVGKNIIVLRN